MAYHKDLVGAELHDPKTHKASHQTGGADEISLAGLSGESVNLAAHIASGIHADAQKVTVRKNTGADVGTRARINLIEGSNITLTVADDPVSTEVDVTIAVTDTPALTPNFVSYANAVFGGGGDGNVTISADTVLPDSGVGVKVMQYNNLTIDKNGGGAGYYLEAHANDKVLVILVKNKLTLNGIIRMNGRGGAGGSGDVGDGGDVGAFGGGGGGDNAWATTLYAAGGGGGGGQNGQPGTSGSPGTCGYGGGKYVVNGTAIFINPSQIGVGAGGNAMDDAAGQAGSVYMSAPLCPLPFETARYLYGGGGGEGGNPTGGNGGTGGGVIWIEANEIEWGASGAMTANGVAGSNGGINISGGGGGGGGFIQVTYATKVGSSTFEVTGGTGGAGTSGDGRAGGAGAAGRTGEFEIV